MAPAVGLRGTVAARADVAASRIMPGRQPARPPGRAGGDTVRQLADTAGSHAFAAFCVASCLAIERARRS
ncbi:hypothetical protein, partial [Escherichia coli]|uniref:hypothetical protein n=1 Tax=Escherichia coli TaxID=562 RepID=UPI0019D64BD1